MKFTDEDLNRLLDGEMSPSESAELRDEFKNDQDLAARYTELAIADMQFKDLVDSLDEQPISDEIYQLLASDDPLQPGSREAIVRMPYSVFRSGRLPMLVFASLSVITFGLLSTFLLFDRPHVDSVSEQQFSLSQGYFGPSHPLSDILSNIRSDTSQNLDRFDDAIVTPILSFKSTSGRLCREFLLERAQANSRSVACRQDSGWQIVLRTELLVAIDSEEYQPATGAAASLYEKQIYELVDGEPFSASDEQRLIEQKWRG